MPSVTNPSFFKLHRKRTETDIKKAHLRKVKMDFWHARFGSLDKIHIIMYYAHEKIATHNTATKIPIPITRRFKETECKFSVLLTAIVNQAILLASVHRSSAPSQGYPQ